MAAVCWADAASSAAAERESGVLIAVTPIGLASADAVDEVDGGAGVAVESVVGVECAAVELVSVC